MTTAVIGQTARQARAVADPSDIIVTPRTTARLRGRRVDRVAFSASAYRMNSTERVNVAEAIATAAETSATGATVRRHLDSWCSNPEPDDSAPEA